MPRLIFDLETDGLLDTVSTLHCAVLVDVDSGELRSFTNEDDRYEPLGAFLQEYTSSSNQLIGHNSIKFDCAVLEKLYGLTPPRDRIGDTMVLGRLVHADIKATDFIRARQWKAYLQATDEGDPWDDPIPRQFDGKLIGSHSLKAWGQRMGIHKGDYDGGWEHWSPEMHDYMVQDAAVTLELEYRMAWLCAKLERNGFPFNSRAATDLLARLVDEREAIRRELIGLFPNWAERLPDFIPKRNNRTTGYLAGVPVERWREHEFNPTSRDHIANRLQSKYGWKPAQWTDSGKPTVDDEVLSKLPYPEAQKLARSFLLDKRIGQLAEGNQAWLNVVKNGRIHASYNTNGAVTGRATHSHPNISQVPRVSSPFGRDCRALFAVPPGWVLVGADQSGLELRCLASDMAPFDGGAYASIVTQGDVHWETAKALFGLPDDAIYLDEMEDGKPVPSLANKKRRDVAKTFIYAFLYGAGDEKIGSIVGKGAATGRKLKALFLAKFPALSALIRVVRGAAERGWIKGIDGRRMPIRSTHAALNTRLQNAGAVICKQWGCDWEQALLDQGLRHGWDGDFAFVVWPHDEYQVAVRDDPTLIQIVRDAAVRTGRAAGDPFNFRCPLDVETKVGLNWAETH